MAITRALTTVRMYVHVHVRLYANRSLTTYPRPGMNTTAATLSNAQIFEEAWRNHDAQVGERCCGCLTTVNMPAATTALKTDDHRSSLQETTDSTGLRAATLQRQIDAAISAGKPATIAISGVYNFSNSSLHLEGCHRLSLVGDGATTTKLLFQGGPRFRTPELPKVLVHGDGGADTFKEGYRLFPNPLVAAGGTYRSGATQQTCQAWCGGNITCKGAVFVAATKRCYSLPTVVSFYPDKGMASWSKVPAQPTDGPPGGGSKWNPSGMLSGVNATNCAQSSIKQLSIDYEPKPKSLFCFAGSNVLISIFDVGEDGKALTASGECEGVCVGANFLAECGGHLYATDGMGSAIIALKSEDSAGALGEWQVLSWGSCRESS
jgi:hypothetical protein